MPNLQDVAKLAGVSTATVSKVLSNTPYVSEPTRQKVMIAVTELGYRPNLAARALVSGKTHIIAVAFPYLYDAIFKDPVVLAIIEGIEDELTRHRYSLLLITPRINVDGMADYKQLLASGYLDGMIAIDSVPNSPLTTLADKYNVPLVVLGYQPSLYRVHCDDYAGGRLQMSHVLGLGHQRIGIISVQADKNYAVNERVRGLQDHAKSVALDFDSFPRVDSDFSTKGGATAMAALLDVDPQLTAVISVNDRMAIGAIQYLQQQGYHVPNDFTVVGYDNLPLGEMTHPTLTTVSQHTTQLGRKSAHLLMDLLNGSPPFTATLSPTLLVRGSSGVPR